METIGAFEAKTHLSALLERVAKGESITITKHGIPTARLTPVDHIGNQSPFSHREIVEGMRALRSQIEPDAIRIRELIEEGRRF